LVDNFTIFSNRIHELQFPLRQQYLWKKTFKSFYIYQNWRGDFLNVTLIQHTIPVMCRTTLEEWPLTSIY